MISANNGDIVTLTTLLRKGASVNEQQYETGFTAMMLAARRSPMSVHMKIPGLNHIACVSALIQANANLNLRDYKQSTVLITLAQCFYQKENEDMMFSLIDAGCDVNAKDYEGKTALHYAMSNKYKNAVRYLIDHGADVNCKTKHGETLLYSLACKLNHDKNVHPLFIQWLLDSGANPNLSYPLPVAALCHKRDMVKMLLEKGADINVQCPLKGSVLRIGGFLGEPYLVKMALQYKAKVNLPQSYEKDHIGTEKDHIGTKQYQLIEICPDTLHPIKPNKYALMMLFVAGEDLPFFNSNDRHVPSPIQYHLHKDLSLINISRQWIRVYVRKCTHENMFEASKKLGLPQILQKYMVYGMSLSQSASEFYKDYLQEDEFDPHSYNDMNENGCFGK